MRITEKEYRQMMWAHNPDQFKGIELTDAKVDLLNEDTALISYSTEVNGMSMLDVSTWVREGKEWRCAFHSENPQGQSAEQ